MNDVDGNALEYILKKLNGIEEMVQRKGLVDSRKTRNRISEDGWHLKFYFIESPNKSNSLLYEKVKGAEKEFPIYVKGLRVYEKEIEVIAEMDFDIKTQDVGEHIRQLMEDFGYKGCRYMGSRLTTTM